MLKNKTAVITGCNRGIGKAILENFARNGADIFAVVRKSSDEFSALAEKLSAENGVKIVPVYADFSSEEEVKAAAKQILSYKLPIDILVNNVGVGLPLRMAAMTPMNSMKEVFEINFFSSFLLTQLISRNMMKNKKGSIVYVSSSAAYDGGANVEYCSSKAAVIGAVKRLAVELGPYNIRVNAVAPGLTETDMGNVMNEEDEKIALSMNIMKRKGQPAEIANAAAFLASDNASFITAQVLRVDGGLR